MKLSISNWEKYNPRLDRKSHSWFRLENSIFASQNLFELKPEQRWLWICLLCLASRSHSSEFDVKFSWLSKVADLSERSISDAVRILQANGLLRVETPDGNQSVTIGITTNERTNDTNKRTNNIDQTKLSERVLHELYSLYPRKLGKSLGIKKLAKEISTPADAEKFKLAIISYKKHCEAERLEAKYIKQFSSFVSSWRDWLDQDVGSSDIKATRSGLAQFLEDNYDCQEVSR